MVCSGLLCSLLFIVCFVSRLGFEDLPFSRRLKKIKEFLELSSVPKADVLFELGEYWVSPLLQVLSKSREQDWLSQLGQCVLPWTDTSASAA